MVEAKCPVCGATVDLGDAPTVGDVVTCTECGSDLEVQRRGRRWTLAKMEEIEEEEW